MATLLAHCALAYGCNAPRKAATAKVKSREEAMLFIRGE